MLGKIEGVYVPVITPFWEDQRVSLNMLEKNICKLNSTPVSGYMPLGSNGEFFMMSDQEQQAVVKTVVETARGKQVFAGVGRESVYETQKSVEAMAALGVDAVFVLTPHYFPKQMTQKVLQNYYVEIADASPVPVILYSAPAYAAGVLLEPDTVRELSAHDNIVALKDTSVLECEAYVKALDSGGSCEVLAGTWGKFVRALEQGARGGVLSSANYIPEICCKVYRLAKEGNFQKAGRLHEKLSLLARDTTAPYGVAGVKAAMNALGYACGVPRRPLPPVPQEAREELTKRLLDGITAVLQEDQEDENSHWL